jgi:integrase
MQEVDAVKNSDDIITIQTLLKKHGSQDYADIWKLGINVAFRISDLLSIQKKHINIDKRELTIVEQKTNKKRTVRLNDTAMKIINRRQSEYPDDKYLFQSRKPNSDNKVQPMDRSTIARKFQEIGHIVGIRLGTHSMRKTRGYMMHKSGVSIEQIARVLNHSSPAVTMAYIGLTQEETLNTYDEFEL